MRKLTIAAGVAVCCWVAAITTAAAQQRQIDFDLQSFHRAAMAGGLFYTEGADIATHMVPRARLAFDYHYKPLVYEGFELQTDAIGTRLTGDIAVSIGFFGRIELGLALPFIAYQAGSQSPLSSGMGTAGLGDLRILSKVRLFTRSRTTVSLKAAVAVPTADKTLVSGGSLSVVPGVLASYRGDRVALLASADYRFVPRRELFDLVIDDQIAFAAGASYRLTDKLSAIVELNAAARAASPFSSRRETPAQALAGVRYYVGDFAISGNVGPGLVGGYGTAAVQFGAGLAYDPAGLDSDGDGVRDRDDACNGEREDRDGFQDHDGCPDPDNDGDGILDVVD
ncbi:MAG: hypothetical protein KDA41_14175, partial [Planctomycetales bacterium]|nr:hypothetical protein [Planctomycetales bacterium]